MASDGGSLRKQEGKALIVTGASGGIGSAVAERMAADFAVVALLDKAIAESPDPKVADSHLYQVDVADERAVRRVIQEVATQAPRGGVVVNCAGTILRKSVIDTTIEEWSEVQATNLTGTFIVAKAAVDWLAASGGGSIVNIGSIWSTHAWPERAAYAASKAAVEHFTRVLALEVASARIRVNAVSPGLVATDFTSSVMSDRHFTEIFMPRMAIARALTPAEVAAAVGWVASDESAPMTGEVYEVHGGYY